MRVRTGVPHSIPINRIRGIPSAWRHPSMVHAARIAIIIGLLLCITGVSALPSPDEWRTAAEGRFSTLEKADVDPFILPLITYNLTKGVIVVLADEDGYVIHSYGTIPTHDGVTPIQEALFDIGSVSKVMTGLLMADAENRGEYNLSSPVNTWLSGRPLPGYEGLEITGTDLATHRSGLPVTPEAFSMVDPTITGADQTEESMRHFQTMTAEDTYEWLDGYSLLGPPGYEYLYSNLGAAIAGDSVAQATGQTYPDLVYERIAAPLGLTSTGASWSLSDLDRRATGYRGYAYPADEAHLIRFNDFWTATGGVHSDAADMAVFLAAEMGLIETPLAGVIQKTQVPHAVTTEGPPKMEQGLFWDILHNRDGITILKKAGETNAHQASIAFSPDLHAGVVILSNTATIGGTHVEETAIALLERMQVKRKYSRG